LLTKIPLIKKLSNSSGDFYCIIHNKFGICRTIIKDTDILNIIKSQNTINIENKTDNLYNNKVLEEIKIIKTNGKNFNFTNILTNNDKSLNLRLLDFFNLNKIKYDNTDTIYVKWLECDTFLDKYITDSVLNYLERPINELI
jgi:hypothetical protein